MSDLTFGVLGDNAAGQHPAPGAAFVANAMLVAQCPGLAGTDGAQLGFKTRLVIRVYAIHPRAQLRAGVAAADNGTPAGGTPQLVGDQIPVPKAFLGGFEGQRVAVPVV